MAELSGARAQCPKCGSAATVGYGTKPCYLNTLFGTVLVARRRRRCRACGAPFQPLDEGLKEAGRWRATPGLVEVAVLAAASWPFATAARLLTRLTGAWVSHEWVRQVAEEEGQAQAAEEAAAAAVGVEGARRVVVLGDGASWIETVMA